MKLPTHLDQNTAQGLRSAGQKVAQYELGDYKNFVYLIIDWKTHWAALVDTRPEWERVQRDLQIQGLTLKKILLTHSHHDHIAGIPTLLREYPGIEVHAHPLDANRARIPEQSLRPTSDGERITLGETLIEVLHTPGHSPGELCYQIVARGDEPGYLFTGDTLFIRDCGRTDLPGGSNDQMFASLQRIKSLARETVILPGHHYAPETASILDWELKSSPPLACQSVSELSSLP